MNEALLTLLTLGVSTSFSVLRGSLCLHGRWNKNTRFVSLEHPSVRPAPSIHAQQQVAGRHDSSKHKLKSFASVFVRGAAMFTAVPFPPPPCLLLDWGSMTLINHLPHPLPPCPPCPVGGIASLYERLAFCG